MLKIHKNEQCNGTKGYNIHNVKAKQEQQFLACSAKKLKFITCGYTVSHSYGLI